jgi:hypothetical protein
MISCGICTAKPFDGSNWNDKYVLETFAEECLRLAKQAKDEHQREILKEMADAWIKLAKAAHKETD